jgi:hypothetical protein
VHVSKDKILPSFLGVDEWVGMDSVGRQVSKELKEKYVVVGQSGFNVSAMWRSNPYPLPNSTESIDFKMKDFAIDWLLVKTDGRLIFD